MQDVQGQKLGSPRPCKLSVRQDLVDLRRITSLKQVQSCTSFSEICLALRQSRKIRAESRPRGSRGASSTSTGSKNLGGGGDTIPFDLPPLIPIQSLQGKQDLSKPPQLPPLIPIPESCNIEASSSYSSSSEPPPPPSWASLSPLDLTRRPTPPSTAPQPRLPAGTHTASSSSSATSDSAAQEESRPCDADQDVTPESELRSCCPLCTQVIAFGSLRAHLGT